MTEAKGSDVRAAYVDTGTPKCPICQMPMNGSVECHLPSCTLRVLQEADVEARVQAAAIEMRQQAANAARNLEEWYDGDDMSDAIMALPVPTNAYDAALLRARIDEHDDLCMVPMCPETPCHRRADLERQLVTTLTQPAPERKEK